MHFGRDTVTFRTFAPGTRNSKGVAVKVPTNTTVTGCSMQPVSMAENVSNTDVATEVWHCIAPPKTLTLGLDATGEIDFKGKTYQVTGVKPYGDIGGRVDHLTVACKRQVG